MPKNQAIVTRPLTGYELTLYPEACSYIASPTYYRNGVMGCLGAVAKLLLIT